MNPEYTLQDVVGGIVYSGGLVLMAQRSCEALDGKWEFPGGKVEIGESHQDALRRELMEELDVDTNVLGLVSSNKFKVKGKPYELYCYQVEIIKGIPFAKEHHRVSWVPINKLLELDLAPVDIPIAEEVCIRGGLAQVGGEE